MKTYQITAKCVGCGGCRSRCPMEAISAEQIPFRILPGRCIGCGNCLKACPLRAITEITKSIMGTMM